MSLRKPFCPLWYPRRPEDVAAYLDKAAEKSGAPVTAALVPHAGWAYSGKIAGKAYSLLPQADVFAFVAVNHRGLGPGVSVYARGEWETPLGTLAVEDKFCTELMKRSEIFTDDVLAHRFEHSIEVQVPFVLALNPRARLVPISMRDYRPETCRALGLALAEAVRIFQEKNPGKNIAVLASSDLSHCGPRYEQIPPEGMTADGYAREQDKKALDAILNLDAESLRRAVVAQNVTICGLGPAAAVMETAKQLGLNKTKLAAYGTSADVSGKDSEDVVGYAGVLIS